MYHGLFIIVEEPRFVVNDWSLLAFLGYLVLTNSFQGISLPSFKASRVELSFHGRD